MRGKRGFTLLELLGLTVTVLILAAILLPGFTRHGCGGQLTACKSNLKNIGTGMEMYSTDYEGLYPKHLSVLTPNYLKTIPECPKAGTDTYRATFGGKAPYNTQNYQDYYFVECTGDWHTDVSVPADYPQYNGVVGLIER